MDDNSNKKIIHVKGHFFETMTKKGSCVIAAI